MSEPLPSPTESKNTLTYKVPNILLKREESPQVLQVRMGGNKQIEFTTSIEYSETEVSETPFVIKATNKINFGNVTIDVLNDAIEGDSPLAASSPTATEYMNNVGKKVMTSFSCNPDQVTSKILGRTVFRVTRSTIILP